MSHFWFLVLLRGEAEQAVAEAFAQAKQAAETSPTYLTTLKKWEADPEAPGASAAAYNEFVLSFNVPAFEALGREFCLEGGRFSHLLNERAVHEFVILNRITPGAVLWSALGPDLARALPGTMANLLVSSTEVGKVRREVDAVFRQLDVGTTAQRSRALLTPLDLPEAGITKVLNALPTGLARAEREKAALVCLGLRAP